MGLITQTKLQKEAKKYDLRLSKGFIEAVEHCLTDAIEKAAARAKKNHRTTLMEQDL